MDLEKGKMPKPRPTQLLAPVYGGVATALTICESCHLFSV
jgi:hypothetical protein